MGLHQISYDRIITIRTNQNNVMSQIRSIDGGSVVEHQNTVSEPRTIKDSVAEHPRIIGFLFAAMVLLSQAGPVAASASNGAVGP